MIIYRQYETDHDLIQILKIQQVNLKENLSNKIKKNEGFVTIQHTASLLKSMCGPHKHIVAEMAGRLVGYALVMDPKKVDYLPELIPLVDGSCMRRTGDEKLEECDFIIMGQICIVKDFRGQGLFNGLYQCFKKNYFEQYKAVVTEISIHNRRSLYAHLKIGFNEIERYTDSKDEWVVVEWEWSS